MLFISMHTNAQTLPVLSVTIDGGKQISDKYQQGTMMLTDEYGKLIELNAKFKTRGATAKNYSMKPFSLLSLDGCFNFLIAFASI